MPECSLILNVFYKSKGIVLTMSKFCIAKNHGLMEGLIPKSYSLLFVALLNSIPAYLLNFEFFNHS